MTITAFPAPPSTPRLNWGHPRAAGLISAFPLLRAPRTQASGSSATQIAINDAARGSVIASNGHPIWASDLPGAIVDNTGSTLAFFSGSSSPVYSSPVMTCAALVRSTSTGGPWMIATRDGIGQTRAWQFRMSSGNLQAILFFGGSPSTVTGTATINDGLWHHVAVTYDRVNITLYVDGKIDTTSAHTVAIDSSNQYLTVMMCPNGSSTWAGYYADCKYWGRALSASEIAAEVSDVWELYRTKPRVWLSTGGATGIFFRRTLSDRVGSRGVE